MFAHAIIRTSRPIALRTLRVGSTLLRGAARRLPERHDSQPLCGIRERPIARERGPERVGLRGGVRDRRARPQVALRIRRDAARRSERIA